MATKSKFFLTFGSCGWDRIFWKNDDDSEELIYEEEGRKNSHQAIAALRAGGTGTESMLISFVGNDEIGKKCKESLKANGIDTRFIKTVKGESTEVNHQYIDRETRDYTLKRFPANLSQNYSPDMVKKYKSYILKSDFVILVSKQPKDFLTETINFCYEHGIKTALTVSHKKFDITNPEDFETLKKVTIIAGNWEEGNSLTNKYTPEDMIKTLPNLIITKGKEGVWFQDETGKICNEPAVLTDNVVETNGAGDTFLGNLVAFVAENKLPLVECIKKAMCASTLEIQKMGVLGAMPKRKETEKLYKEYYKKTEYAK